MEQRHSYLAQIMRLLEMRRNPTPKQMEFIDAWKQKAIPMDLIRYAYEKTVEKTDRLSFPYMQSILNDWTKARLSDPSRSRFKRKTAGISSHPEEETAGNSRQ